MNEILHNPSRNKIVEAIESNSYEYRKWFSKSIQNGEIIQDEEFYLFCSGLKYGFTNFVVDIKIKKNTKPKIEAIVSFFKKRGLPFLCLVGPNTEPKNIRELLTESNFRLANKEPAMAFFLDKLEVMNNPIDEMKIMKPNNHEALFLWNNIRREVYEFPEEVLAKSLESSSSVDLNEIEPQAYKPKETPVKSNGNDVSLEHEVGAMIKNSLRYKTYIQLLKKKYQQIELAINVGR